MESEKKTLSDAEGRLLKQLAGEAIQYGLQHKFQRITVDPTQYPAVLQKCQASFVTLRRAGTLRGCMGRLEARRTMVEEVAHNAHSAAFEDPRFPPLTLEEWPNLNVTLSLLGPPEPLPVRSEQELLQFIRPGIDGLILTIGSRVATLLPAVWENVENAEDFLKHLKQKAGLPPDSWSNDLLFQRYTAKSY